jgi:UDP-N-acetylmuramoyl-tripeptide--D-alanyl-D-alanine ligase
MFHWLAKNKGVVFINSLDEILVNMSKRIERPVFFPQSGDYYQCDLIAINPWVRLKCENEEIIQTKLVGLYNFSNIAAALCIAKFFEVSSHEANKAVSLFTPGDNRSEVIHSGSNTIILDAYNANPDSMKAALENLSNMEAEKKVAILGDMYELGDLTQSEHMAIGKMTRQAGIEEVIFVGERMRYAKQENRTSLYFKTRPELENYIENRKFKDCLILIKGSRAMALEIIAQKILEP